MSLLINDSQHLTIADNAYVAREFMMALSDSLHQLAADNIDFVTAEIILLALEDALQAVSTVEPRITSEALVALVRDVLARGYYFFKARTKTKR
jgi:hypothetical protein